MGLNKYSGVSHASGVSPYEGMSPFSGVSASPAAADGYTAEAVVFDGTSDYANAFGTGTFDVAVGTISIWIRLTSTPLVGILFSCHQGVEMRMSSTSGNITVQNRTSGGSDVVVMTTTEVIADNDWHHIIASWDTSDANKCYIYIDGASTTLSTKTINAGNARWNVAAYNVAARPGGTFKFRGEISELWADRTHIDLTIAANLEKFISSGAPVSLGADGSSPTGTQADVYVTGDAAAWNAGTAMKGSDGTGGFTMNGSVSDSANEPVQL